jgi:hypothetical protein
MIHAILLAAAMMVQPSGVTSQIAGAITATDPQSGGEHYDAWPVEMHGGRRIDLSVTPRGSSTTFGLSVHDLADGRTLAASAGGVNESSGPPARFILCPGHARCPRG